MGKRYDKNGGLAYFIFIAALPLSLSLTCQIDSMLSICVRQNIRVLTLEEHQCATMVADLNVCSLNQTGSGKFYRKICL
jgi:hypothetical protein